MSPPQHLLTRGIDNVHGNGMITNLRYNYRGVW